MKLTSMKRTKKNKANNDVPEEATSYEEGDYPYGFELRLEKDSLDKLGLDLDSFSIGGTVDMVCQAEITHLSESANKNNSRSSASFQITDMAIKAHPRAEKLRDILSLVKAKLEMGADA